jgi:hypothetical protein
MLGSVAKLKNNFLSPRQRMLQKVRANSLFRKTL